MKDMRGVEIQVGDTIAYGKSSRYDPINIGKVVSMVNEEIEVLGKGNTKTGKLGSYNSDKRILVLPDDYLEKPNV